MIKLPILLLFSTFTGLMAQEKTQENPSIIKDRDQWSGYPIGSWAVIKKDQSMGEKKRTFTEKRVKIANEKSFQLDLYKQVDGKFPKKRDGSINHLPGLDPSKSKLFKKPEIQKTTLTIDGKEYACTAETYNLTPEASANGKSKTIRLWKCDTVNLPYRELPNKGSDLALGKTVIKAYYKYQSASLDEESIHQVIKFDVKEVVNGKSVNCFIEQTTTRQISNKMIGEEKIKKTLTGIAKRWITHDIPGSFLKHQSAATVELKDKKTFFEATKTVIEFGLSK